MRLRNFLAAALFAALGLQAPAAFAQDAGPYQVLGARYGIAPMSVDVTQRLRDLVRGDQPLQINNELFGTDPAPGNTKTLRIHARSPDGQVRIIDVTEGQVVDGRQFNGGYPAGFAGGEYGWGGPVVAQAPIPAYPQPGYGQPVPGYGPSGPSGYPQAGRGGYQIIGASYGDAGRRIDVTRQVRDVAQRDQRVRVDNRLFGTDPAPGTPKTLRIDARGPDGAVRSFDYREGDVIDGAQFAGGGNVRGNNGRGNGNGYGGGYGNEGGQYRILQARYGTAQRNIDVTDRLRDIARSDQAVRIDNDLFGLDPVPGQVKTLRIYARGPGGNRTFEYREGQAIDGGQFAGWRGGNWERGEWRGGWGGQVR